MNGLRSLLDKDFVLWMFCALVAVDLIRVYGVCKIKVAFRAAMAQWDRYVRYSFGKTLLGGLFCDDHRIYWNTYGQSTFMWKTISDPWDAQGAKIQRKIRTKWTIHMRKTSVPLNANSSNR